MSSYNMDTKMDKEVIYKKDVVYIKKKKLNILLIDDSESEILFKQMLELRGHKVIIMDEGLKSINKIINEHFDIIFVDFHMKDINGIELTKILKEIDINFGRIIAYTGDTSVINKFKKVGASGAIIKPLNGKYFVEIMELFETENFSTKDAKKITKKNRNFYFFE